MSLNVKFAAIVTTLFSIPQYKICKLEQTKSDFLTESPTIIQIAKKYVQKLEYQGTRTENVLHLSDSLARRFRRHRITTFPFLFVVGAICR